MGRSRVRARAQLIANGWRLFQYRLRVGDISVFYDVTETQVQVLAIVTKAEAHAWLDEHGTPTAD